MKAAIKKLAIQCFTPIGNKLGFIHKKQIKAPVTSVTSSLLNTFYQNIKTMNFTPQHIIDVGANHGNWTRESLKHFPNAHYTLLEPQDWLKPSFQDILDKYPKVSYHAAGAGAQEGSFLFTIADRDDSSSFRYNAEEAKTKGLQQKEIPVITLNSLIGKEDKPFPDLVKIDAEGMDFAVLDGASQLYGTTEVFMVEAAVGNKEFKNSLLSMSQYMDEKGYRLFDFTDLNRPFEPRILWLVEMVFIRKGGILDQYAIRKQVID
jgi:FkbM family methyltransferase